MDLHWPYVKAAFPPNRRFILSRRDDFEDAKSRAWTGLGIRDGFCARIRQAVANG